MLTPKEIFAEARPILLKHGIRRAGLFGSFANGSASETSDIDLLVELGQDGSLIELAQLQLDLEKHFERKVDLVEYAGIKPLLKNSILGSELRFHG